MSNPTYLIIGILAYIFVVSSMIGVVAVGMGYDNPGAIGIDYTAPDDESILSSIPFIGETFESAGFIGSVITAIASVLFWTVPEQLFPLWANILFIKIPLVGLIFAVLDVLLP